MPLMVPKNREPASLADWAELLVLAQDGDSVSVTRLGHLLQGDGADLAAEEILADAIESGDGETEVEFQVIDDGRDEREFELEQLLDEIGLRLELGRKVYPFEINKDRIIRREVPGEAAYLFLLILSWPDSPARKEKQLRLVEAAFDGLAIAALRRYMGRDALGVRFARNSHDPDDGSTRPKEFKAAVKWLREQLKLPPGTGSVPSASTEVHWENEDEEEPRPLNTYKDAGVDVVVWWHFKDGRAGSPVMLAQCTCQLGWGGKDNDIKLKLWGSWINFATVPPQTALVIPFAVERDANDWFHHTLSAGVVIDRHRFLELLDELGETELVELMSEDTEKWTAGQIAAA